eukprot:8881578-Ditylum_brightwellii.AAC.1
MGQLMDDAVLFVTNIVSTTAIKTTKDRALEMYIWYSCQDFSKLCKTDATTWSPRYDTEDSYLRNCTYTLTGHNGQC